MKSNHKDLLEDDWFVASTAIASDLTIKKEVSQEQLLKDFAGEDDDDDDDEKQIVKNSCSAYCVSAKHLNI